MDKNQSTNQPTNYNKPGVTDQSFEEEGGMGQQPSDTGGSSQ